jgi:hypothetical protein
MTLRSGVSPGVVAGVFAGVVSGVTGVFRSRGGPRRLSRPAQADQSAPAPADGSGSCASGYSTGWRLGGEARRYLGEGQRALLH